MTIVEKAERIYSRFEHRADAVVHVLGILFAINASLWLLWHVTGLSVGISVLVYCAGLLAMISASAAYNLAPHGPSRQILRRLDHAAIFIMIAATYTPFAVNRLGAPYGGIVLTLIWLSASFGVVMKVLYPRRFEVLSLALYLGMGWMIVTVLRPLHAAMGATDFWLLVAGGLVYSAGVAFYVIERIPYHKAIWHAFVLVAAVLHFSAIAFEFAG
ncbi:MAG TPA: hemolysin III family protein [Rhizomicrobium sp.]|jgi:hemolysin III|nr:hemolysin III family protein [Rhizomicrobium sp.]